MTLDYAFHLFLSNVLEIEISGDFFYEYIYPKPLFFLFLKGFFL